MNEFLGVEFNVHDVSLSLLFHFHYHFSILRTFIIYKLVVAIVSLSSISAFPLFLIWDLVQYTVLSLPVVDAVAPKAATPFLKRLFWKEEEHILPGRIRQSSSVTGRVENNEIIISDLLEWRKFDSYSLSTFSVRCLDRYFQIFRMQEHGNAFFFFECIQAFFLRRSCRWWAK